MALALISVVYSALRAGSNTALLRFSSYDYGDSDPAGKPLLLDDDDGGRAYVKVWSNFFFLACACRCSAGSKACMHAACMQAEDGTSAGLDGGGEMSRGAVGADEAAAAAKAAEDLTPVTYNYSFFHLVFALASMYLAMLMTGALCFFDRCYPGTVWCSSL
jgi:hypothetical protein